MMLYDRIFEAGWEMQRHEGLSETEDRFMGCLVNSTVYDISEVAPLLPDWEKGKDQAVPKTPPHDRLFCEWSHTERSEIGRTVWRLGVYLERQTAESVSEIRRLFTSDQVRADIDSCEGIFVGHSFKLAEFTDIIPRKGMARVPTGVASQDMCQYVFLLSSKGSRVRSLGLYPTRERLAEYQRLREAGVHCEHAPTFFGLAGTLSFYENNYDPVALPWPPFMAFALLHCKNVVTEEHAPNERIQRECRKHNRPPRVTYKTLRIEVPKATQERGEYEPADEDDPGPRVRFHLCGGHFKHLTHERYTGKRGQWVWCPAHWKGSKELGEVHKRYRIERKEAAPE